MYHQLSARSSGRELSMHPHSTASMRCVKAADDKSVAGPTSRSIAPRRRAIGAVLLALICTLTTAYLSTAAMAQSRKPVQYGPRQWHPVHWRLGMKNPDIMLASCSEFIPLAR